MILNDVITWEALNLLILDEVDEMLSNTKEILYDKIPQNVQIAFFSTTMTKEVSLFTKQLQVKDPVKISLEDKELILDNIKQSHIAVEKEDDKLPALFRLLHSLKIVESNQVIIFVNTSEKAIWLKSKIHNDFTVCCIHDQLSIRQRDLKMKEFRSGICRILITTDILSRGIDIKDVLLVINYDLPICNESYIHRIGRCGRYRRQGCAISFVIDKEVPKLRDLENVYNTKIGEIVLNENQE